MDSGQFKALATKVPQRDNSLGAVASAVAIVAIWVLHDLVGLDVTPEVSAAITTIVYFLVTHFTPRGRR